MDKTLVVVESPAKAKTIKKYLGSGFEVKASVGHIKDLPTSDSRRESSAGKNKKTISEVLGVNVEDGFKPQYEIIPGKEKVITELKKASKNAQRVLLATDPDREGEAIAWHVSEELDAPPDRVYRVLFNELTEKTIKQAIESPARLDYNKYNAQQARRILDRIVGYQLSPLLWQKVQSGLSAGRVQSVALRLIVDRQKEIDLFVPQEYWSLSAVLEAGSPPIFEAKLVEDGGKKVAIADATTAEGFVSRSNEEAFVVAEVKKKERSRRPVPPFITSTLQQEASRKLRMNSGRTMRVAQQLYEGVELGDQGAVGLITYMRTDSPRIAPEAVAAVRELIRSKYGDKYLPAKPNTYKGRKTAQEAHECIRPTSLERPPEAVAKFLDKDQLALYKLIWNRFIACQMAPALFDQTTASIDNGDLVFRVTGSVQKFDGFLRVYQQDEPADPKNAEAGQTDKALPPLKKGDELKLVQLAPRQHFTQPPAAFTEASLIKELEEKGIGRPSTYADIVTTIRKRKYADLEDKKFKPTVLGRIIADLLSDSFPHLLDARFTADMESLLDKIEEGSTSMEDTLGNFYDPFQSDLKQAKENMFNVKRYGLPTGLRCPDCGEELLLRTGRFGLFLGCSAYPECGFTANISTNKEAPKDPIPTDKECPNCKAQMVIRDGRAGPFLACSRYPECKTAMPLSTGVTCPKCGKSELVQRRSKRGKTFYSCGAYPDCDCSYWNKPVAQACPKSECDSPILEEKWSKKSGAYLQCPLCKTKLELETENTDQAETKTASK